MSVQNDKPILQDALIGKKIDGYYIEALLGRGGMARVYRAYEETLNRFVAFKVIDPHMSNSESYRQRFQREARAVAQLKHPNIVMLYRFNEVDGLYYMVMDYVDGADLRWILQDYRHDHELMPYAEVYRIIAQAARALDYAHKQGVIHRDIKPSNIMLRPDGTAVLTDFGLALITAEGTQGDIFGSPYYVAPEQAMNSKAVQPQSDLYALGVILYEMLTGRVPYQDGTAMQLAMAHMVEPLPHPQTIHPDLPAPFVEVLQTALAKEPSHRYPSGVKLTEALRVAIQQAEKATTKSRRVTTSPTQPILKLSPYSVKQKVAKFRQQNPIPPTETVAQRASSPSAPQIQSILSQAQPVKRSRRGLRILLLSLLIGLIGAFGVWWTEQRPIAVDAVPVMLVANPQIQLRLAIEGEVQEVGADHVRVFDFEIRVPLASAFLDHIAQGDVLRLEGTGSRQAGGMTLTNLEQVVINGQRFESGSIR